MRCKVIDQIRSNKIIVIIRDVYCIERKKLVNALWQGGIRLVEFTFDQNNPERWSETLNNISETIKMYNGEMVCGAGTVLTCKQVQLAKSAGAEFIISPDVNQKVIEETVKSGMVSIPGALSPSEIVSAQKYGADFVKVFPASSLGISYIKAIRDPLNHIPFLVVGGVNYKNVHQFMNAGAVGAGLGGEIVNKKLIAEGNYEKITELAKMTIKNCRCIEEE